MDPLSQVPVNPSAPPASWHRPVAHGGAVGRALGEDLQAPQALRRCSAGGYARGEVSTEPDAAAMLLRYQVLGNGY